MKDKTPSNEAMRNKNGLIDQRQQQIDPAGKHRVDQRDAGHTRSQKQPGQDLRDPQDGAETTKVPDHAGESRADPGQRQNAQGDHAGSAHSPEEFDVLNPQKQGLRDGAQVGRSKTPSDDR